MDSGCGRIRFPDGNSKKLSFEQNSKESMSLNLSPVLKRFILLGCFFPWLLAAQNIAIVSNPLHPQGKQFAEELSSKLKSQLPALNIQRVTFDSTDKINDAAVIVSIGQDSLSALYKKSNSTPVVATLLEPIMFENTEHLKLGPKNIAIFHQSPWLRQAILFKEIFPIGKSLGILIDKSELDLMPDLVAKSAKIGVLIEYEVVEEVENLSKSLLNLIDKKVDAVIATENSSIYNRSTIKGILLTLYRHNKFLIGANQKFIKAGSVASCYTTLAQLVDETMLAIIEQLKGPDNADLKLRPTRSFSVSVNRDVARSLNIILKSEQDYTDAIRVIEINLGGLGEVY